MRPARNRSTGYHVPVVACVHGHERVRACIAAGMTAPVLCNVFDSRVDAEMEAAVHLITSEGLDPYDFDPFIRDTFSPEDIPVLPSNTGYPTAA